MVRHRIRQLAAEDCERARKNELRRPRQLAAPFQQRARRIEIDSHPDIELGFGLPAHDGGEVEDRIGVWRKRACDQCGIGEITRDDARPRIAYVRSGDVDEHQLADLARIAAGIGQATEIEYFSAKAATDKTGAAGDQDAHY